MSDQTVTSAVPSTPAQTAVLLCQDIQKLYNGLNLAELGKGLEVDSGIRAEVVPDLCQDASHTANMVKAGARRLVLGVCSWNYAESEVQHKARGAGLDPLGIVVVDLGGSCASAGDPALAMEKARVLLLAAVARARAFSGSKPENVKPHLPPLTARVSRRALFTLPPIRYVGVAFVDGKQCVADRVCDLCARACPRSALGRTDGAIQVEKARCEGCGICVTACPVGAVELPGHSVSQYAAEVRALLGAPSSLPQRNILFLCQRAAQTSKPTGIPKVDSSPPWLPVQVPCLSMVTVPWILGAIVNGAASVGLLACEGDCPFGQNDVIRGRVEYCTKLLRSLGQPTERLQLLGAPQASTPALALHSVVSAEMSGDPDAVQVSWERGGVANSILALVKASATGAGCLVEHPHSPLGLVEIRASACTGCGACAESCPTGALTLERKQGNVGVGFDASLCTGCGLCVPPCPEAASQAIMVRKVTDTARLAQGKVAVYRDEEARCVECGAPIAPRGMLRHIANKLGSEQAAVAATIGRYCSNCRVLRASGGLFPPSSGDNNH